jgi:hypothetical protein
MCCKCALWKTNCAQTLLSHISHPGVTSKSSLSCALIRGWDRPIISHRCWQREAPQCAAARLNGEAHLAWGQFCLLYSQSQNCFQGIFNNAWSFVRLRTDNSYIRNVRIPLSPLRPVNISTIIVPRLYMSDLNVIVITSFRIPVWCIPCIKTL